MILFRWFVGLGIEDPAWDASPFTKNRDRLLEGDVAAQFLAAVLAQDKSLPRCRPGSKRCCRASISRSTEPGWKPGRASLKSFRAKDGSGDPLGPGRSGERDFHGEPRRNDTHVSTTDPEAACFAKGWARKRGCASWATH